MTTRLQVDSLGISFLQRGEALAAVRDVSFSLSQAATLGIVGESGSGKSACCNALLGLHPKFSTRLSGSAKLEGVELINASERTLRSVRGGRIGMVFQDPMTALNPHMTIGRQLVEPARLHRAIGRHAAWLEATRLLDEVGIKKPAQTMQCYAHELSGGMRQRVLIAMALIAKPEFLLADEPTTALDVSTQAQILALLDTLRQRYNMGLLFVSHDLHVVEQVCEDVLVMRSGQVVERGPCKQIFSNPQHPYTRALLDAIPHTAKPFAFVPGAGAAASQLSLQNIDVVYRKGRIALHAVKNASLSLRRGEVLGVVGESGSGKSSLARAALRLLDIHSGEVQLGAQPLHQLQGEALRRERKRIQMVFQDPYASLNPRKTLFDTLAEPLRLHRICANQKQLLQKVGRLLDDVGLESRWHRRYPHQLSGGQRQRLAIARALAPEPEFLIADEAVSALDVSVQAQILDLLLRACKEQAIGMLFITHDIAVVRYVADRVAVMHEGVIVEQGDTERLLRQPAHAYTRSLLGACLGLELPHTKKQ
ncbi:MAG: ABC transporter ATP-binding protein [Gammaproteobacteria bacterium]|nr:ABC transporter ATP-binding protein [Gammaproteobacteria bacterium]NND38124.1 ABC transporter ATP-binding protein [Pseudomonadales bacterium]